MFSYRNVSSSCVFLTNVSSSCVFLYKCILQLCFLNKCLLQLCFPIQMSPPAVFAKQILHPAVFSYTNVPSSCVSLYKCFIHLCFPNIIFSFFVFSLWRRYNSLLPPTCQYCVFVVLWMRCCWITTIMVRTKRPWLGARWRSMLLTCGTRDGIFSWFHYRSALVFHRFLVVMPAAPREMFEPTFDITAQIIQRSFVPNQNLNIQTYRVSVGMWTQKPGIRPGAVHHVIPVKWRLALY